MRPDKDLPDGWTAGAADADRDWARVFGEVDSVSDLARPIEALPSGFAAYTVVLHPLLEDNPLNQSWLKGFEDDPWSRVRSIYEHGLDDDRYAGDIDLALVPDTARALAQALEVDGSGDGYVLFLCFSILRWPEWTYTLTSPAMSTLLNDIANIPEAAGRPSLFYPLDRRWAASAPFDMGCTYIGSDHVTAERLRSDPDLETLPCR